MLDSMGGWVGGWVGGWFTCVADEFLVGGGEKVGEDSCLDWEEMGDVLCVERREEAGV